MTRAFGASLAILALFGCVGRDNSTGSHSVRDSAGVIIVESARSSADDSGWKLSDEPVLQLGVVDGDSTQLFSDIGSVACLSDGRIVVTDGDSRDVRYFSADGHHLVSVGRRGQGPEEYRGDPGRLFVLPGDSLSVEDRLDRLVYDSEGRFVERITGRADLVQGLTGTSSGVGGTWLGDGTLMILSPDPLPTPLTPAGPARQAESVIRISPDHTTADTVLRVAGNAYEVTPDGDLWSPVFYAATRVSRSSRGTPYVITDGSTAEVHRFGTDGRHEILRWQDQPQPITPQDVEHWISSFVSRSPNQEQRFRASFAAVQVPAGKPVVGWVVAGTDGAILLASGRPGDPAFGPLRWTVIDSDGAFLGRIDIPEGFVPLDFGPDYVLGEWRDELDVPHVRMYQLSRQP